MTDPAEAKRNYIPPGEPVGATWSDDDEIEELSTFAEGNTEPLTDQYGEQVILAEELRRIAAAARVGVRRLSGTEPDDGALKQIVEDGTRWRGKGRDGRRALYSQGFRSGELAMLERAFAAVVLEQSEYETDGECWNALGDAIEELEALKAELEQSR